MKIESSPDSYIGLVAGGPHKTAPGSEAAGVGAAAASAAVTAAQPSAGVTVTLSSTSRAMSAGGNSNDVFNAEKVETMKQALANGTFQVNAEAIADKMLSNAADMLSATRT